MDKKKSKEPKIISSTDLHNVWEIFGTTFKVDKWYKVIEPRKFFIILVGSGAYGTVVSCEDSEATDEASWMVAIKKIEKAFEHPLYAKWTLREMKILWLLSHENVRFLTTRLFS